MMSLKVGSVFLILSINSLQATLHGELLELSCANVQQCKQFKQPGVNVTCSDGHCRCSNSTVQNFKCAPPNTMQSNIIGGHCPCRLPQAECNKEQGICYCVENYVASDDKRRCIPEMVPLNEECELDAQCHATDNYAICDKETRRCACRLDFISHFGSCVSVAAPNITCSNDSECLRLGAHMACSVEAKKCICTDRYIKASNKLKCLPVVSFRENCSEHLQCQKILGPGGSCVDDICHCTDNHYVLHKKIMSNDNQSIPLESVCEPIIEIGKYCRTDDDCHQHHLPAENQTMSCMFSECNCKFGFYSINGMECTRSNYGNLMTSSFTIISIVSLVKFLF